MPVLTTPVKSIEDTMLIEGVPEYWHQGSVVLRDYQYFLDDARTIPLDMTAGAVEMKVSTDRGTGTNIATFTIGSGITWVDQAQGRFLVGASINYTGSFGFGLTAGGLVLGNHYSGNTSRAILLPFDIDYVVGGERYRLFYGSIPYLKGTV